MAERCIYADDFLDLFYVASAGQDKMFVKVVEQVVEDTPTADVVEVVRCKDCIYFQPDFVLTNEGNRRPYTEEEIQKGKMVTSDIGINCSSRCERFGYWEENSIPVWFNENDFCSYGKRTPKERGGEK